MIFEKKKEGVEYIQRMVRKSNDYGTFERYDCNIAVIPSYGSIDIDSYDSVVTITVNSNVAYAISYSRGDARKNLDAIIKSEVRDSKIEKVLNAS